MAEEIINIQIVEEVENITISIQEPSKTSDLINDGADGVHPFITSLDISNKVDKVTGKGLSTNDYTTAEQAKLAGIQAGAEVNVNADWNATSGDAQILNKPTIPSIAGLATTTYVDTQDALKVDKVAGYSLTKNDLTDLLKTAYDNAVSSLATLLATGQRLITSAEITKLSNLSGTNTGDQNLTGLVPYTGASTDVDLNTKNLKVNNVFEGFTSVAASATLITLTVNSTPSYLVTGSGGQTIKLPNATTLQNGAIYDFNNNQSSGAISVNNNSNTLIKSIPSGGYLVLTLIDNSTTAGSWDAHFQAPSNVSWSTNTFDVPASITSATWNGVSIADNRIASATTWNAKEDSSNKVTTFTGNETSTTKFPVVKAILDYFTAANIKTILGITTLSGSNTGDQDLSGKLTKSGDTITGDIDNTATGYFRLPNGTTAQRPATPLNGMRRYNTDTLRDEFYANGSWQNHARLTGDTFTGAISATNLSGTNTGDQDLSGLVSKTAIETITGKKTLSPSVTASGAIAQGTILTPTLTAAANNDVLVGLDINPTFTNGAFSGVKNYDVRLANGSMIGTVGATINNIYLSTQETSIGSPLLSGAIQLKLGGTTYLKVVPTTGNVVLQNGGTFTDLPSARLQVNSTTQGFLPPRMTNAQRIAITSPAIGLMVYCTDATEGVYVYKSTGWAMLV